MLNVVQVLTWAREASSSSSVTPLTPRIVISAGSSTSASPHAMSAGGLGIGSATIATASSSVVGTASSGIFSGVYAPPASGAGASGGGYGGSAPQKARSDMRQAVRGTLSVETAGEVSLAPSDETVSTPLELPFSPYADMPHTPDVRSVRALRQHDDDETSTYSFVRKKSSYRCASLIKSDC